MTLINSTHSIELIHWGVRISEIMKIQRTSRSVFVTIPANYAKKIKNVVHMRVFENEKGNLEYEAVKGE